MWLWVCVAGTGVDITLVSTDVEGSTELWEWVRHTSAFALLPCCPTATLSSPVFKCTLPSEPRSGAACNPHKACTTGDLPLQVAWTVVRCCEMSLCPGPDACVAVKPTNNVCNEAGVTTLSSL